MKMWLTAAEFAELAASGELPGLPATKRGMNLLIAREGWAQNRSLCRSRQGREGGGGDEFHIDLLPLSTRLAYAARHCRIEPEDLCPTITDSDELSIRARAERDARLVLVRLADRFRHDHDLSIAAADALFSSMFNGRSIDVPAWVHDVVGCTSARSLARWRAGREHANSLGHDPSAARKGTGQLDRACEGRVKTAVLAAIAKKPFISAAIIRDFVADTFGSEFKVPPLRTFQQTLKSWKHDYRNELLLLTDPDGYRSRVEFAATNATNANRLNQIWQIDASPADVMLKGGRHSIYLAIDVYSRRIKVLVTPTPRAAGVAMLMRTTILAWGLPETVKTDNGSDFTATATVRLLTALGIHIELSPPYEPRTKGMVERAIGTFQRALAGLPGFIGHSVADRKVIENRKAFSKRLGADPAELYDVDLDLAEFQEWCDVWSDTIYASTPHEGLGRLTPFQAAAAYPGTVRRIDNAAALDVLVAPVPGKDGIRTVTKSGIPINRARYMIGTVMVGTSVFCRMDPRDLGRILVFEEDGETFLGEAVCPELAGLDPVETIARVKAAQKAMMDENVKPIRAAMRKIGPRAIADAMRREGEKRAGNLIAFPQRTIAHSTPAMDAAATATQPHEPAPLAGKAAALHARMLEQPANPLNSVVTQLPETREQRFRRALDLEARRAACGQLSDAELLWLGGYQNGSEYRAMRQMLEEFGPSAMRL